MLNTDKSVPFAFEIGAPSAHSYNITKEAVSVRKPLVPLLISVCLAMSGLSLR